MKVVILAGGFGTRLSEYTDIIPKPMVLIGDKPILVHLMNLYAHYGHKDFYVALGYKSDYIKRYFKDFSILNSDFKVDLQSNKLSPYSNCVLDWSVSLVDTGLSCMTGGRVLKLKDYIGNQPFLLTYGDGLSNVNINELIDFHNSHNKLVTVTSVRPIARFGELLIEDDLVKSFKEKPAMDQGWINGGFFVCDPGIFDYLEGCETVLEQEPMEKLVADNQLAAYKHNGFWQCMDSKRDLDFLNDLLLNENAPWILT